MELSPKQEFLLRGARDATSCQGLRRREEYPEHDSLQRRYAQEQLSGEALRADLAAARAEIVREHELRQTAETAAALAAVRKQVIEEMLSRLGAVSPNEISPPVPKDE